jgi:hypothetical protein
MLPRILHRACYVVGGFGADNGGLGTFAVLAGERIIIIINIISISIAR